MEPSGRNGATDGGASVGGHKTAETGPGTRNEPPVGPPSASAPVPTPPEAAPTAVPPAGQAPPPGAPARGNTPARPPPATPTISQSAGLSMPAARPPPVARPPGAADPQPPAASPEGVARPPSRPPAKSSSHADRARNVALSALTGGSIGLPGQDVPEPGFLSAGGGERKVLPELVLPYQLPVVPADTEKEDVPDTEDSLPLEKSVVFLQAMRQTRMMHMLQVLPPFSHRLRTGTEYFDLVPRHLVQDIDPHAPHTLLPLGKADVNAGPVSFAGVKFYELARAGPDARAFPRGRPRTGMPGPIPGVAPGAPAAPGPGPTLGAYPGQQSPARPIPRPPGEAPPVRPLGQPGHAGQGQSSPGPLSSRPPVARPAPTAPHGQMPRPRQPVDTNLVAALEEHAEHKPQLLQLLHLARTGQITGKQLPQMNAIIAGTARAAPTPPRPAMPHVPERRTGPPVVLVEFPENASVNFLLPLWSSVVERREAGQRSVVLSFFIPAIGSKAAGDSGRDKSAPKEVGQANGVAAADGNPAKTVSGAPPAQGPQQTPTAGTQAGQSSGSAPAGVTPPASRSDSRSTPRTAPPKRSLRSTKGDAPSKTDAETPPPVPTPAKRMPTRAHELFPVTWRISNMDTRLWDCIARVPGCVTSVKGGELGAEHRFASDKDRDEFDARVQSFHTMYAEIPTLYRLPRQVQSKEVPAGLEDHVTDRYAVRIVASTARPQPKRKVATISESRGIGQGPVRTESGAAASTHTLQAVGDRPPKRKRHVATHNSDGSIKSCGACGKTKTPMWRRGPLGPSQLCNACGAKWKAGRLVVPDVPPPPILDDVLPVRPVAKAKQVQAQGPQAGPGAPGVPGPHPDAGQAPMHAQAPIGTPAVGKPPPGPGTSPDTATQASALAPQTSGMIPQSTGVAPLASAVPPGAIPPNSAPLSNAASPSLEPPAAAPNPAGSPPTAAAEPASPPATEEPASAETSAPPDRATGLAQPPPAPTSGQ